MRRVDSGSKPRTSRGGGGGAPRRLAVAVAVALDLLLQAADARAEGTVTFGLGFRIAREAGERVVDDAWVNQQIEDANHFFVPLGVAFRWTQERELAEPHDEMHSRADRDALTSLMAPPTAAVIDVFLVRELEDVDEPGRMRMGVCWTGREKKRFIILSRTARPTVLAHELGHFFGNRQHSAVTNNLMSYTRDGGTVFLDDVQAGVIRGMTRTFLETGRLLEVGPPRRSL